MKILLTLIMVLLVACGGSPTEPTDVDDLNTLVTGPEPIPSHDPNPEPTPGPNTDPQPPPEPEPEPEPEPPPPVVLERLDLDVEWVERIRSTVGGETWYYVEGVSSDPDLVADTIVVIETKIRNSRYYHQLSFVPAIPAALGGVGPSDVPVYVNGLATGGDLLVRLTDTALVHPLLREFVEAAAAEGEQ